MFTPSNFNFFSALCLSALIGVVSANPPSTYTQEICSTRFANTKPASIKTTLQALTLSFTLPVKATITPTSTVTPSSATATTVTTSTSIVIEVQTQATDVFTITNTQTEIDTVNEVAFSTVFSTSVSTTVVTSTTTIPTPAGFTAFGDYLQAKGDTYAKRDEERQHARDMLAALDPRGATPMCSGVKAGPNGPIRSPQAYPATVGCKGLVEVVATSTKFYTAKPTTVTAAQGTITRTSTSTSVTTTTSTPIDASTTIFTSATITQTTTSTSTSIINSILTSVSTSFAPQATYYAACAPNNLVSTINGNSIAGENYGVNGQGGISFDDISTTTATSAYDCCVQCFSSTTCTGTDYFEGTCDIYSTGNSAVAQVFTGSGNAFTISNGYRGGFTV